jgi:hypothetical protein
MSEELDPASAKFLSDMREYLTRHYGERCPDRQPGCKVCQMWAVYDLTEISIDYP